MVKEARNKLDSWTTWDFDVEAYYVNRFSVAVRYHDLPAEMKELVDPDYNQYCRRLADELVIAVKASGRRPWLRIVVMIVLWILSLFVFLCLASFCGRCWFNSGAVNPGPKRD
jgi:hypothetical protein